MTKRSVIFVFLSFYLSSFVFSAEKHVRLEANGLQILRLSPKDGSIGKGVIYGLGTWHYSQERLSPFVQEILEGPSTILIKEAFPHRTSLFEDSEALSSMKNQESFEEEFPGSLTCEEQGLLAEVFPEDYSKLSLEMLFYELSQILGQQKIAVDGKIRAQYEKAKGSESLYGLESEWTRFKAHMYTYCLRGFYPHERLVFFKKLIAELKVKKQALAEGQFYKIPRRFFGEKFSINPKITYEEFASPRDASWLPVFHKIKRENPRATLVLKFGKYHLDSSAPFSFLSLLLKQGDYKVEEITPRGFRDVFDSREVCPFFPCHYRGFYLQYCNSLRRHQFRRVPAHHGFGLRSPLCREKSGLSKREMFEETLFQARLILLKELIRLLKNKSPSEAL